MGNKSEEEAAEARGRKTLGIWAPQEGPQVDAITADWCPILLYGGAKYGGKTDFLLGDYLQDVLRYGKHWQGIIFRRALTEFTEIKLRSKELFYPCGATWHEQAHEWRFPNGAILRFKYLEKFEDISLYEGHSYSWVGIDELGDWDDQNAFFRCLSLNRYGRAAVKTLRLRATCNPGGRGHSWIKKYFIDPAPHGYEPLWDEVLKCYRLFIPARLEDNKIGLRNDPNYESRLMRAGSPALIKALRYGDWNVVAGAFFNTFSSANIIQPFEIPSWWTRFVAYDPGSSDPFCITWWAVSDGTISSYPKGALICYREWYGEKTIEDGERVRGLKLSVKQIAEGIAAREHGERIGYRVAGHDLWDTRKGPSDAELFGAYGIIWLRAEVKRKQGWRRMYEAITGEEGKPLAYWFSSCIKSIEHIPLLQHSTRDPEDVEDSPLDHAPDSCRYGINSRPYASNQPAEEKPFDSLFNPPSLEKMWKELDRGIRQR